MDLDLCFQNMPEIKSIRRHVEREVDKLNKTFIGIEKCKVIIELPYHHRYPGNIYNLKIELTIPEDKLIVTRSPSVRGDESNLFNIIHEAFDEMYRMLLRLACVSEPSVDQLRASNNRLGVRSAFQL